MDKLNDLPDDIQDSVLRLDQPDAEAWIRAPVPALGQRSVLEVMNEPGGEARVREFLGQAFGKFG